MSCQKLTIPLIIIFIFLAGISSYAQGINQSGNNTVNTSRWFYGMSLGSYFAHASTANYYNGTGEHSAETALNYTYNRERLIKGVNEIIQNFTIGELPSNMHYSPASQIGFFGGMRLNGNMSIISEINYTKITAAGKFTVYTDKYTSTTEPYIILSDIYGKEERIEMKLGFGYTIKTRKFWHPFIESGIILTDTRVIENKVNISGLEFSVRDITTDYYQEKDYGMSIGMYNSAGIQFMISDNFSFRTGGSVSFGRINLGNYTDIVPQYNLFLRLNLNEIFANPHL
jgi:hypothetical protein